MQQEHAPGDRYGFVTLRRKSVADRCEVGYHLRTEHGAKVVILGRGPTWEAAFARASS